MMLRENLFPSLLGLKGNKPNWLQQEEDASPNYDSVQGELS